MSSMVFSSPKRGLDRATQSTRSRREGVRAQKRRGSRSSAPFARLEWRKPARRRSGRASLRRWAMAV